jgi:hypothetical protein
VATTQAIAIKKARYDFKNDNAFGCGFVRNYYFKQAKLRKIVIELRFDHTPTPIKIDKT